MYYKSTFEAPVLYCYFVFASVCALTFTLVGMEKEQHERSAGCSLCRDVEWCIVGAF